MNHGGIGTAFVTASAGFIGTSLVDRLLAAGYTPSFIEIDLDNSRAHG